VSFAGLGETLEIEKLAYSQAPQGNQDLVQDKTWGLWHGLEPGAILLSI
jgi:hypothetical protein